MTSDLKPDAYGAADFCPFLTFFLTKFPFSINILFSFLAGSEKSRPPKQSSSAASSAISCCAREDNPTMWDGFTSEGSTGAAAASATAAWETASSAAAGASAGSDGVW